MKIFDVFTFYNELDLLELRMNILGNSVDYFVINEANITFTGKPKPLYFAENRKRFKKWDDKIIYHLTEDNNKDYSAYYENVPYHRSMVEENIKGRKDSVAQAEGMIEENSETEFRRIKNKKSINIKQKEFRESLSETKDEAVNKAKDRILKGDDIENIIDDLANEISSKNAFTPG